MFPEFERLEIIYNDDVPCIELIGDHYSIHYQIWFDDCPVETKFVTAKRLHGTIPNVAHFTGANEWPAQYPINVHINLVLPGSGFCVASGLIFTYTPVYIEGILVPLKFPL